MRGLATFRVMRVVIRSCSVALDWADRFPCRTKRTHHRRSQLRIRLLLTNHAGLRFENAGWQPIPEQSPPQEPVVNNESPFGRRLSRMVHASTGEPNASTSETQMTTDSVEKPTSDGTADNDVTITKEPTVLDHLRGFYIPRREETPVERGRKTTRRWTDPFGLLRDRETETGDVALGATTPLSPQAESETTAAEASVEASAMQGREDLLEPLITQIEQELAEWTKLPGGKPDNEVEWLRRQTDLRMLYLIAGRSAESIRVIESLPEKEQEFWQSMMLAMESYRRHDETDAQSGPVD